MRLRMFEPVAGAVSFCVHANTESHGTRKVTDDVDKTLWQAYRSTRFEASTQMGLAVIRIDQVNPELDRLLVELEGEEWAFITAWNPLSSALPLEENRVRNREMESLLRSNGYRFYPGRGIPADSIWDPEESFLVIGMSRESAVGIGREFGQNAVVWGARGEAAVLLDCR